MREVSSKACDEREVERGKDYSTVFFGVGVNGGRTKFTVGLTILLGKRARVDYSLFITHYLLLVAKFPHIFSFTRERLPVTDKE